MRLSFSACVIGSAWSDLSVWLVFFFKLFFDSDFESSFLRPVINALPSDFWELVFLEFVLFAGALLLFCEAFFERVGVF